MHDSARRITRIAETEIHWVEAGSGPPIVLLHGLTDSHRTWSRVAPALARTHRVFMPDLAGHGLSGRPDASYSLSWHAHVIGEWLDAVGIEQTDVVGHSFGGGVAQWLLLERRARVRRLGLVAAGGLGRDVGFSLRLAAIPKVVEHLGQPFMGPGTNIALRSLGAGFDPHDIAHLSWMNSQPGSARALARTVRDVIDLRGQRRNFLDHAHEISDLPPMGLYWGDRDPVIPSKHGVELMRVLHGATLTSFPNCGHFPHRECPDKFLEALGLLVDAPEMPPVRLRRVFAMPQQLARGSWWRRMWHAVVRGVKRVLRVRA